LSRHHDAPDRGRVAAPVHSPGDDQTTGGLVRKAPDTFILPTGYTPARRARMHSDLRSLPSRHGRVSAVLSFTVDGEDTREMEGNNRRRPRLSGRLAEPTDTCVQPDTATICCRCSAG